MLKYYIQALETSGHRVQNHKQNASISSQNAAIDVSMLTVVNISASVAEHYTSA